MFERLEAIKVRYEQLTEELSKPEVLGDYNQLKKLSKEQIKENFSDENTVNWVINRFHNTEFKRTQLPFIL